MAAEMTPLCGYGMLTGSGTSTPPVLSSMRAMKRVIPVNGDTVLMPDEGKDGMLLLAPAGPLQSITLGLPVTGDVLQMDAVSSMQDIASIEFTGGVVLNAPVELLANQAIQLQRIRNTNNTWITI